MNIPTPYGILTDTATINNQTWALGTDGVPEVDSSTTTQIVNASIQPAGAQDALLYGRDTSKPLFNLYMAPVDTANTAWSVTQADKITVNGTAYKVVGVPINFVSASAVIKVVVEGIT